MAAPGPIGLLDRELETSHVQRAVDHSSHGAGRLLVIEGPAGIGKTSLIGMARGLASEAGMKVRTARAAELERSFPFGVVRQLLDAVIAGASDAERSAWLSGAAELAAPLFDPAAAMSGPGEGTIYPRLHGLYWLCANLARDRPLALLIDDAHWADEPSLEFLGFLARRLEALPVLLALSVRSGDQDASESLELLRSDPAARTLRPRGLSSSSVGRLLEERLGTDVEEGFAHACQRATTGNPFLVGELVQELRDGGVSPVAANADGLGSLAPRRVAQAVLTRLERLSPAAPQLARAMAILGEGAGLETAAALAGMDERVAIETATALRKSGLLGDHTALGFAHPIIRAAIYRSVLPAERTLRHAEAAALLYERRAPAEHVAAQVLLAEDLSAGWALEQLLAAAGSALAMGAPRNAVAYLRRALTVEGDGIDRAIVVAMLGQAEALSGLPEAVEHLSEAIRLTADPDLRARIAIGLAQLLTFVGQAPRAVQLLSRLPPPADPGLREGVETEMLSEALMSAPVRAILGDRLEKLSDRGVAPETDRQRFELVAIAYERIVDNRPVDEPVGLLMRACAGGVAHRPGVVLSPWIPYAVGLLVHLDAIDEADTVLNPAIESSRRSGALASVMLLTALRGQAAYRRGRLDDAAADAALALQLADEMSVPGPTVRSSPIGTMLSVTLEQNSPEAELQQLLDRAEEAVDYDAHYVGIAVLPIAQAMVALGRPAAALDRLLEFGRLPRPFATGSPANFPWRSDAALIMHQLGDQQGAVRLAAEELELAREMRGPRAIGVALRVLGVVQPKPAVDLLAEAVDALEISPARLEHARALVDLGGALRRAGQRAAARDRLRDGYELAVRCSATKLADRARKEMAATGARVAPAGPSGVAALTPSERRVAELAAQGHSNRDIAQTLFVTEKTVETHLGRVYNKLDVRSRHKLRDLLPTPELTPA